MSSYWASYAWLPDGCQASVSFEVDAGRFARVRVGVEPRAGQQILSGVTPPALPTAIATPSIASSGAGRTPEAAASGPGVSRCTPSPPASIPIPTSHSPEVLLRWRRPDTQSWGSSIICTRINTADDMPIPMPWARR